MSHSDSTSGTSLVRETLRTVALLTGACVLFVGALSLIAVFVTSRVVGPRASDGATATESAPSAKKPLSI